ISAESAGFFNIAENLPEFDGKRILHDFDIGFCGIPVFALQKPYNPQIQKLNPCPNFLDW
ncbi:MAG: hypothetical protein KKA79_09345, partial [Nanoarchaeota archaeon]|nr:hypothetical protein [Nanoarchaeota archaeon]